MDYGVQLYRSSRLQGPAVTSSVIQPVIVATEFLATATPAVGSRSALYVNL